MANGDAARFLADYDADGIGSFGEPDGCAMAEASGAVLHFFFGHRKDAGGAIDAVIDDDDASVVEWGFGEEDRHGQFAGELRVELDASVELFLEADFALEREEGSDAFFGEVENGFAEIRDKGLSAFIED